MKIKDIDHIVITTSDLQKCFDFYTRILGMKKVYENGRYSLLFGNHRFNIHTRKAEFLPAALHPEYGSLDLCLTVEEDMQAIIQEIQRKSYPIEFGPVERHGALGTMQSIYLRDPDGNLIELSSYRKEKQECNF